MTDKPWNSPTRKPYVRKGPQNVRMRCQDCGAQFHELTQQTKMDLHCWNMSNKLPGNSKTARHGGDLHHSWRKAVGYSEDPYAVRTVSDATDELNRWMKEDGYDLERIGVKRWLELEAA